MKITVSYILDNDNWTDKQFEDNQDTENLFEITEEMIKDLIRENVKLGEGDWIDQVYFESNS